MGQSFWLTHCIKHQHHYNLTSSIFKHSLLFLHNVKNTTQGLKTFFLLANCPQMLCLLLSIYSIPPKHVLIAVSDFAAREEQNWNLKILVQFSPPHPGKSEIPTLGTALNIKFPTPGAQEVVKSPGFVRWRGKGMLQFWFDRRIRQLVHDTTKWQGVLFFSFLHFNCAFSYKILQVGRLGKFI